MTIIIMKFGGSCLIDTNAFKKILEVTKVYENVKKVYVVSALRGATDLLLNMTQVIDNEKELDKAMAIFEKKHFDIIEKIFKEDSEEFSKTKDWLDTKLSDLDDVFADIKEFGLEPYYKDYILSFGERLSTFILDQYLLSKGLDSEYISANNIIITNDEFNNAYPLYNLTNSRIKDRLIPLLENPRKDTIISVTGFIARNKIGYITTLGRGGSDYTASILARSIYDVGNDKDIRVVLWKDVDGLLAINPKFIPEASLIKYLDYKEAKEIANFGAKILHPKCLEAIEKRKLPLEIRNFDKPQEEIYFSKVSDYTDKEQIKGISAVDLDDGITMPPGFSGEKIIHGKDAAHGIHLPLIMQPPSQVNDASALGIHGKAFFNGRFQGMPEGHVFIQ